MEKFKRNLKDKRINICCPICIFYIDNITDPDRFQDLEESHEKCEKGQNVSIPILCEKMICC